MFTTSPLSLDTPQIVSQSMPPVMPDNTHDDSQYNYVFLNDMQRTVIRVSARHTYVRAGRGTGKSALLAIWLAEVVLSVPRSTIIFAGASYSMVLTRTLPQIIKIWENVLHWSEGIQFFRGHAPKSAGFDEPLSKPRTWGNCIHMFNGTVIYLASLSVSGSCNGLTASGLGIDELKYCPFSRLKEEAYPCLRSELSSHPGYSIAKNPYYLSLMGVSDAGINQRQIEWELERNDQTLDINEQICEMLAEYEVCPELEHVPAFIERLNYLRGKAKVFFNFSSIENISILTEDYLKQMQRNLPPLMFNIQIMGQWKGQAKDGYYANFDIENVHGYYPPDENTLDLAMTAYGTKHKSVIDIGGTTKRVEFEATDIDRLAKAKDCKLDTDVMPGEPLCIALDTNKNINCFCIAQTYKFEGVDSIMILNFMYTMNERRLRELCKDFSDYYAPHRSTCNEVIFYYDSTNKGTNYALEDAESSQFYNVVKEELAKRHWKVTLVDMGVPMRHQLKYQFVNDVLKGEKHLFVRVNKIKNDYLIASLENSRITYGKNGIRKDKSVEKVKRAGDDMMDEADERSFTDASDAFDNIIQGCILHPKGRGGRGRWRGTIKSEGPIIL